MRYEVGGRKYERGKMRQKRSESQGTLKTYLWKGEKP
jgi:hypothetical protein